MHNPRLILVLLSVALGINAQSASKTSAVKLETEVVYVGPGGFFPSHIQRPHGKFTLLILNHSGTLNLSPQLAGSDGQNLLNSTVTAVTGATQSTILDLSSGTHHMKEGSHSKWDLQIDIN